MAVLGDEPLVPEPAHRVDDREERLALPAQRVVDPTAGAHPLDDPLLLEDAQSLGERSRADPGARALELGEAAGPFGEVVDDHRRPFGADDVGRTGDRAVGVVDGTHRAHRLIVEEGGPSPKEAGYAPTARRPSWQPPRLR